MSEPNVWVIVTDDGCPFPPPMPMTSEEHRAYEAASATVIDHQIVHVFYPEQLPDYAGQCSRCAELVDLRALVDDVHLRQFRWAEDWHASHHDADQAAL